MADTSTIRMLQAFENTAPQQLFFSGFFNTGPGSFYNSEYVDVDVFRGGKRVAVVLPDLSTGARMTTNNYYVNKQYKPPIYKEGFTLNGFDMIRRQGGMNPYSDPGFQAAATAQFMREMQERVSSINRAIELQASQVMQTGTVTLTDTSGNSVYTIDYKPNTDLFFTVGTAWDDTSPDIMGDLLTLLTRVYDNGNSRPTILVFGRGAFNTALKDDTFVENLDKTALNQGALDSYASKGTGGTFHGRLKITDFMVEVWTYDGKYEDPDGGTLTSFMNTKKVCAIVPGARLQKTFGSIPMVVPPEQRLLKFLPPRISSTALGLDLTPNVWVSEDNESLMASVGTRPLLIPVAMDTFGCLDSDIT